MLNITLKGGVVQQFEAGTTAADIAKSLGTGLYKAACAAKIDGVLCDLRRPITSDCAVEILTFEDAEGKKAFWHTSSHILAQAVLRLFPGATFAIGPAIDNGFYYDFDVEAPFTPEDLIKIEAEMNRIVKEDLALERFELEAPCALERMQDQPYKLELIKEHADKGERISFYGQGDFIDLCAGPHLMRTGAVRAISLLSTTGAYWRGSEKNKMLSRIYGVSFPKRSQLDEHLTRLEEAKKRDHRRLGRELELFALLDEGPGFPFFLPNGMVVKNALIDYWRNIHRRHGYVEISTPILLDCGLWRRSGHWDHYKNNMYTTVIDGEDFAVKPMNCPGGMLAYRLAPRSYRDLPMRVGELGLVHRHEMSGALHGLMRVRCFTQDDAHIFMTPDQVKDEVKGVVTLIDEIYSLFGFQYHIELSTMPEDHMGDEAVWQQATESLRAVMEEMGLPYVVNEGDGAFYGPKLDFHLEDSIGRTWQCGTVQLDFQMPERFELEYTGADGLKHRPVMIHRVAFGSIERFIGILIEHFAGAFPLWLAPVQAVVIPVSERFEDYAAQVTQRLLDGGIRAEKDLRPEKIGYKIREAQLGKIPYMLIVGEKETQAGTVSVRSRAGGDLGAVPVQEFLSSVADEIASRAR
jgi:threonyl-tRNA synthetase